MITIVTRCTGFNCNVIVLICFNCNYTVGIYSIWKMTKILSKHCYVFHSCTAPMLSAEITARGRSVEGQIYTLTCAVGGDELLAPTNRRFQWDKGSSTGIHNGAILTFNPIHPDDTGDYTCTASFNSPYLTGTKSLRTETMSIAVLGLVRNLRVTTPTSTTLPIIWTASGTISQFEVTYSYTVKRCSAPSVSNTETFPGGSMRSYTLSNLNEDSRYTITVTAINTAESTMETIMADTLSAGMFYINLYNLLLYCLFACSSQWLPPINQLRRCQLDQHYCPVDGVAM